MQLQSLEDKLQKLMLRFEQLKKENNKLKSEVNNLQTALVLANKKTAQLQQKNDALAIGIQHKSPEEKKQLQSRIDAYLKEIDKCLSLLDA
ncbi:MAG: hypothetical protein PW786_09140 [Arachidicoccus sp.]|nr:hypothetical protein [Arachidicoccus sp.]